MDFFKCFFPINYIGFYLKLNIMTSVNKKYICFNNNIVIGLGKDHNWDEKRPKLTAC